MRRSDDKDARVWRACRATRGGWTGVCLWVAGAGAEPSWITAPVGEAPGDRFGRRAILASDLDGNGFADLVVAAGTRQRYGGPRERPCLRVLRWPRGRRETRLDGDRARGGTFGCGGGHGGGTSMGTAAPIWWWAPWAPMVWAARTCTGADPLWMTPHALSGLLQPKRDRSIRPWRNSTPSDSSRFRCSSAGPPTGSEIRPDALITRCQGTAERSGSDAMARPTRRARPTSPAAAAIWP